MEEKICFLRETDDIFRLKVPFEDLYTSVFLIRLGGGKYALADAATTEDDVNRYILHALSAAGVECDDVSYLVITHSHSDHAGGKDALLKACKNALLVQGEQRLTDAVRTTRLPGHTEDFIGVFDERSGTLISGDGLQGAGVGKYRCGLSNKEAYLKTLQKIEKDESVVNALFSHAYEPWYKDGVFGREEVLKALQDCKKYI